ncbi:hypothetical protein [Amycolatopsis thermoflava]|uniref:hypothetical protein n=1 Tax=Amycolatopsis thermoflava TaxID=84480 RepID=UPI003D72A2CA
MASNAADDKDCPSRASSLPLLTVPYVFTQDRLLTTGEFLRAARERGHILTLDDLQDLHHHRLLPPLYHVTDDAIEGRRIPVVSPSMNFNVTRWTFEAAADGRLRDGTEDCSAAWPFKRPADKQSSEWWNGFVYSSWQLLHVGAAVSDYQFLQSSRQVPSGVRQRLAQQRQMTLALAVLATPYLPGVLGQLSLPAGVDQKRLREYRAAADVSGLLRTAGFDPAELEAEADFLLMQAQNDPLAKWLPLVRHASYRGWSRLRGEPLDAMWRRIAADVLLRAHEELATAGVVEPLPDLTGTSWHAPQHDRLTPRFEEAQTLERALAELGLSPHPKVILLIEGETERYHVPRLLAEFGVTGPQDVRVQHTKSSKINAHLIARYGAAPRVGRKLGDRWLLDASPTALLIAMDPENHFATPPQRERVRRNLQEAIREEVRYQDAEISQADLDFLVRVRVWGDDKYELANFADDDLLPALTRLAERQGTPRVSSATWEQDVRAELHMARANHYDVKVSLQRLGVREDKVELAKLLWPVLRDKCESEFVSGSVQTPVLKLVLEVREMVAHLAGTFAIGGDDPSAATRSPS